MSIFKKRCSESKFGTYRMQCDRTGLPGMSTEMRKTWDGLWVLKEFWYERNPQDFIRVPPEKNTVPVARPLKTKPRGDSDEIF